MDNSSNAISTETHRIPSYENVSKRYEEILQLGLLNTKPTILTEHFAQTLPLPAKEPVPAAPTEEILYIEQADDPELQIKNILAFIIRLSSSPAVVHTLSALTEKQYKQSLMYVNNSTTLSLLEIAKANGSLQFSPEDAPTSHKVDNPLVIFGKLEKTVRAIVDSIELSQWLGIPLDNSDIVVSRKDELSQRLVRINKPEYHVALNLLENKFLEYKKNTPIQESFRVSEPSAPTKEDDKSLKKEKDRLLVSLLIGERNRDQERQQQWLDQERERDWATTSEFFSNLYHKEEDHKPFQKWFVDTFNSALSLTDERQLKIEDMSSMGLSMIKAETASKIAGQVIERPVIIFHDPKEYSQFMDKLFGTDMRKNITAILFQFIGKEENIFVRSGMIFASGVDSAALSHEITHTIDKHVKTRIGADRILMEAFAFFQQYHQDVDSYKNILGHYYEDFLSPADRVEMSKEDFRRLIDLVVDHIVNLKKTHGEIEVLRILAQTKTIDEFIKI